LLGRARPATRWIIELMKAEIIAVGSELLTPDRLDTNSLFLTEELNKLGIEVVRKTIVGDNRELLAEAFRDALERVPLILASGGLGPTEDDLTRETVAELLHRKLILNEAILKYIEGRFRELRVAGMGESALEQRIKPIYTRYPGVHTTILAAPGEIQIHLRTWTDDAMQAQQTLDEIVQSSELALTDRIYSKDGSSMEEVI